MELLGRIVEGAISVAEACAPGASWAGTKLVRFSDWIEEGRQRVTRIVTAD